MEKRNWDLSSVESENSEKRVLNWLEQYFAVGNSFKTDDDLVESLSQISTPTDQRTQCNLDRRNRIASRGPIINPSKARRKRTFDSDSGCLTNSTSRRSYSLEESKQIINYILSNDTFNFLKGNLLWQKMEVDKVCERSWQSMKNQFIKKIYPNLRSFSLLEEDRKKIDQYMKPTEKRKHVHLAPGERGWRKNGKFYTLEEDLAILNHILQKKRCHFLRGNSLWQTMEERGILPGRTWQSMKSRYLNIIRHSLEIYNLQKSEIEKLLRAGEIDSSETYISQSTISKQAAVINVKKSQEIRRYALRTAVQLAVKLKLHQEPPQHGKNTREERYIRTTDSDSESHASEIQECVGHKSYEKNAEGDKAVSGNSSVDSNTCALPNVAPTTRECAVEISALPLSKRCIDAQTCKERRSDSVYVEAQACKETTSVSVYSENYNNEYQNNNEPAPACKGSSVIPDLQEQEIAKSTNIPEVTNNEIQISLLDVKSVVEDTKRINNEKTESEDETSQISLQSLETLRHTPTKCFDLSKYCQKCSAEHNLSPSSN